MVRDGSGVTSGHHGEGHSGQPTAQTPARPPSAQDRSPRRFFSSLAALLSMLAGAYVARRPHAAVPRTGRPHRLAADHQDLRRLADPRAPGRTARPREPRGPCRRPDPPGDARRRGRRRGSALLRAQGHGLHRHPSGRLGRTPPPRGRRRAARPSPSSSSRTPSSATSRPPADATLRARARPTQLESRWSKEKILNEYLNSSTSAQAPTASRRRPASYFGVDAKDLTLAQAALLAGLPEAPSAYSPRRDPEAALARRDLVLNKMYQQRYISSDQLQEALEAPLQLADATADNGRDRAVLGGPGAGATGGPLRFVHRAGGGLRVYHEPGLSRCSRRPRRPSATCSPRRSRARSLGGILRPPPPWWPSTSTPDGWSPWWVPADRPGSSSTWPRRAAGRPAPPSSPSSSSRRWSRASVLRRPTPPAPRPCRSRAAWPPSLADEGPLTLAQATADSSNGVFARLVTEVGAAAVAETAADMGIPSPLGAVSPAIALDGPGRGHDAAGDGHGLRHARRGRRAPLGRRRSSTPPKRGYPGDIVKVTDARAHFSTRTGSLGPG